MTSDERRGRRSDKKESEEDPYAPKVLNEGPKKYRFEDWASI